ncbi:MAG TPA: hypothetical protein EYG86_06745 [Crocinitomicaceae bacterium]|nr:hypothetical protein [Crocinitomicaceae bacterium]
MKKSGIQLFLAISVGSMCLTSCENDAPIEDNVIDKEVFDPNSSLNTVFDGKIFSVPSPVQTAYLIKDLNLEFDASLGNNVDLASDYVTEYQQSLNLGVYGADLGYSALYDQKNTTLKYLAAVQNLTSQLGLDAAFNDNFLENFETNSEDDQKMIHLMSEAFKQADNFLKNGDRKATSAWILTGGWIESLHFACQLNAKHPSADIKQRIGEQKQTIGSIVDILTEYNNEGMNDQLITDIKDLKDSFDKVVMNYEYIAPETNEESRISNFRHKSSVEITEEVMKEIETKITAIRATIIKA